MIWDLPKETKDRFDPNPKSIPGQPVFSPNGALVALGVGENQVQVIDVGSEQVRLKVPHADCALGFSTDNQKLLVLTANEIRWIGVPDGKILESHLLSQPLIGFDCFSRFPQTSGGLASAKKPGVIDLWDLQRVSESKRSNSRNDSPSGPWRSVPDNKSLVVLNVGFFATF